MNKPKYPSKIISGGQTGADYAGLLAGVQLGLETGGTAPRGWRICLEDGRDGSNPELARFGLIEHASRDYPPRTKQNVADADGTVWFGYAGSPGGKLTVNTARRLGKPCIVNPSAHELRDWLEQNRIEVLNVAGNRLSPENPNIQDMTFRTLVEAIDPSEEEPVTVHLTDGTQTQVALFDLGDFVASHSGLIECEQSSLPEEGAEWF
jgi:hypothetical protein